MGNKIQGRQPLKDQTHLFSCIPYLNLKVHFDHLPNLHSEQYLKFFKQHLILQLISK